MSGFFLHAFLRNRAPITIPTTQSTIAITLLRAAIVVMVAMVVAVVVVAGMVTAS